MISPSKNIFLVGIKGVAMSNLALILKKMGKTVSGADVQEEFVTDELLKKNNIHYSTNFKQNNLPSNVDLIVYSAAHGGIHNPLVLEAKRRGLRIISQAELLGVLLQQFKTTIAVAGCHGKTTTSSLLSHALIQLGVNPSYLVGAPTFNHYEGGKFAGSDYFVVEADEYGVNPPYDRKPKFHFLKPRYIICTNIDFDHPDVYKDLEETKKAFQKFFDDTKLIVCADDSNLMSVVKQFPQNQYQTYGFTEDANYVISNVKTDKSTTRFQFGSHKQAQDEFTISLFGEKNVSNATAVIVMLKSLGFTNGAIQKAICDFHGAKRRFEKVFSNENFDLYDDYGHHPREIEATISAARTYFTDRRIIVIFQPHTFSRTQVFLKDFIKALSLADLSLVLPIFASARENVSDFTVSSQTIEEKAKEKGYKNIISLQSRNEVTEILRTRIKPGDVVFTLGAGDVYTLKNDIIDLYGHTSSTRTASWKR